MTKYNLSETSVIFLESATTVELNERNDMIWTLYDTKTFYAITKKKMFEKALLNKIGLKKYKFYKQLPRKIKYKIEDAWHNAQRTKKYNYITVNGHGSEWWRNEFNRLLKIFYLLPNN